jgi:hypothetical protein
MYTVLQTNEYVLYARNKLKPTKKAAFFLSFLIGYF